MKLRAIVVLLKHRSNVQKEGFCNPAYAVGRFEGQASLVFLPSMRRTRSIWDPEKRSPKRSPLFTVQTLLGPRRPDRRNECSRVVHLEFGNEKRLGADYRTKAYRCVSASK